MSNVNNPQRLEDKIDKIVDRLGSIDVTLGKQAVSLEEHMKRSDLLEKKMEPLEKHVNMVNGVLKFIGVIAMLAGIAEVVIKLVG